MKKLTAAILLYILLVNVFQLNALSCGDVDDNSKVTIKDALSIALYSTGRNPPGFVNAAADVNGDGIINITDALLVAMYSAGLITDFPLCPIEAEGVFLKKVYKNTDGETIPYCFLIPENRLLQAKYPLFIFLHGAGELGDDNERPLINFPSVLINEQGRKEKPCFILVPQCPVNDSWSSFPNYPDTMTPPQPTKATRLVIETIELLCRNYNIDRARIYISGLSLGGEGTFDIVTRRPDLFAAAVPICGIADAGKASLMLETAFWIFHGDSDEINSVEYSRMIVAALKALNANVKYTEYPGVGHSCWGLAYNDPGLFPWMFAQRKTYSR